MLADWYLAYKRQINCHYQIIQIEILADILLSEVFNSDVQLVCSIIV